MSIVMRVATPDALGEIVEAVAGFQRPGRPVQLHPGDLGWNWSLGMQKLADAVRVWSRDGEIVAVGMGDDDGLIRMGIAPSAGDDAVLAGRILDDLPDGYRAVEARSGRAFRALLDSSGWVADESWTPLTRDLAKPVEDCGLRVETIDPHDVRDQLLHDRVAVQRAAFPTSTFTVERWRTMAAAPAYRRARCLVAYDNAGNAVATATVWTAGPGRPGLLEPLGVHRDHRGQGHGRAITVAAAAALQEMGSSHATVCTPTANTGGVATYVSAGFEQHPPVTDFRRPSR
ncbi:GNAT family N-acetyltransferase [Actinoplanes sp. Pm04-4]|uniref:GNAT family N-acetyltransferase n=1 Tax=Paractinoplanes pyxinae TaxID=2997416 RepID=A0ABT4AY34_9ACTN|nr:GNAT family N-acetyltransferase [Actinoplanes pyxinae]MCY1139158.1 GNAT family N-acetyltransferase [Actinoplanes pyxinae]